MGRTLAVAALVLAGASACGDSPAEWTRAEPVDLALEWTTASPESQGVRQDRLDAAYEHARTLPRLLSLLVVRHGRLVYEKYFNGNHADSLNDVRSVTKSVIGSLVGTALAQGVLSSVDVPIGDYLKPPLIQLEPDKAAIRVRDLLTMSSGFEWDESTVLGYNEWVLSGQPLFYLLDRPLVTEPGQTFNYNSAAVHLLSVALAVAGGTSLDVYAYRELFAPLGISRVRWELMPDNFPNGSSGIDLRPRDLAKLGQLWLQSGWSGTRRLMPAAFVEEGTRPAFATWTGSPPIQNGSYGFLWWIVLGTQPADAYYALGFGGQVVWVSPDLDVVVVVTTDWRNAGSAVSQLSPNALDLIVARVLPAFRR